MPKKGPDIEKIKKIRNVLKRHSNGLWVREIARKTNIDKSTVSIYLAKYMKNEIEDTHPHVKNDMIKVVRLKK
jgi:DNA invertase Pin-like site-specific DNA recombinase